MLRAALVFPPLVGLVILLLILSGLASSQVLNSGAATSTALLVGALLILAPPTLYAINPDLQAEYQTAMQKNLFKKRGEPVGQGDDPEAVELGAGRVSLEEA